MGTAVLLPQDCLPTSKSRHKPSFTDVLYGSRGSIRARGGTFHALDPHSFHADQSRQKFNAHKRTGWSTGPGSIPVPEHSQAFAKNVSLQRDLDVKKPKVRRATEAREVKVASKSGPDIPVFTILQRPKDKELAEELIVKFLKVEEAKGQSDTKADLKVKEGKLEHGSQNTHLDARSGVSSFKKRMPAAPAGERPKFQCPKLDMFKLQGSIPCMKVGSPTMKETKDGAKLHGAALISSKPVRVAERSSLNRLDDLLSAEGLNQMMYPMVLPADHNSLQISGAAEKFCRKLVQVNRSTAVRNMAEGDVAQLRRAFTDPHIGKHALGQNRSAAVEVPRSDERSLLGITRSSSMSCPERWAGPAYSSSPAPSSLPLPKFSRAHQKLSFSDASSPLVEGFNSMVVKSPESGLGYALPGVPQEGALDTASATRSLRRMLKLETF